MDLLAIGRSTLRQEARAVADLAEQLEATFVQTVELLVGCRGHVVVSGVGTTGMVGRRLAHLLCCAGCPSLFLHSGDSLHGSSAALRPDDVLVLLSRTGETSESVQLAEIVRERGVAVVTLTARPDSRLGRLSSVILQVETPVEVDPFGGAMSLGSSLTMAAMGDALVATVLEVKGTPKQAFIRSHPGGIASTM